MRRDEIRPRDAVAVEKHAVVAARRADRAVADLGGAKSAIHLPDMGERHAEARLPALDQRGGRRPRAVVGDHDLELAVALTRQRRQHRLQRILAIVGRDDDGDELGHVLRLGSRVQARALVLRASMT